MLDDYLDGVLVDREVVGNRTLAGAGEPAEGVNVEGHVFVDWARDDALCGEGGVVASSCIITRRRIAASRI